MKTFELELWITINSILQIPLIIFSIKQQSVFLYITIIMISHAFLYLKDFKNKTRWLPNTVTLIRLCHIPVLYLFRFNLSAYTFIIFSFLILDGLDGLLAKKLNVSSTFGDFFDKECDATFVSILMLFISIETQVYHLIIIGLLRYIYVIFSIMTKKVKQLTKLPEHKSQFCRVSFVLFLICIILGCYFNQLLWAKYLWNIGFSLMVLSYFLSFKAIFNQKYDY